MAVSFVVVGLFGERLKELEYGGWVAVGFAGAAMVVGTLVAVAEMLHPAHYSDQSFTWLHLPGSPGTFPNGFSLVIGVLVDP
ncbi:MAG TPA: hypothetical protein VJQ43_03390, partial [Thermoplasmata archaeon]|nr:hypothetical protein [Thermoplasmata archaeon]